MCKTYIFGTLVNMIIPVKGKLEISAGYLHHKYQSCFIVSPMYNIKQQKLIFLMLK